MRILQIANFVTDTSGGLRRYMDQVALGYVERGHDVSVIVPGESYSVSGEAHGSRVTVPGVQLPRSGGYRVIVGRRPLKAAITALHPDVVELSDKTTLAWLPIWLAERGIPCVVFSHERTDLALHRNLPSIVPRSALSRHWNSLVSAGASAVVCASDFAAQEFNEFDAPLVHVPLGVDLEVFRPRRHHMWTHDSLRLTYVGRLSAEKSPGLMVATVAELVHRGVDVECIVIGDGPLRSHLEERARDLPIKWVGHSSDRQQIAATLAAADVAIAPGRVETFGLSVLESLACGTPVVVPNGGAAGEILPVECGVVAYPNRKSFADAIQLMATWNREDAARACRRWAEGFAWNNTVDQMLKVLATAIQQSINRSEPVVA